MIASKQIQNDGVPLAFALFQSKMHGFKKRAVLQIFCRNSKCSSKIPMNFQVTLLEDCRLGFLIMENAINSRLHVP